MIVIELKKHNRQFTLECGKSDRMIENVGVYGLKIQHMTDIIYVVVVSLIKI